LAAVQLLKVAAGQGRDQDAGADDRHGQQHLEGRLGNELYGNDRPVGCGEERAPFEQELEVQVASNCMLSLAVSFQLAAVSSQFFRSLRSELTADSTRDVT